MYYLVNWPRVIRVPQTGNSAIHHVICNRDKILIAVLSANGLTIFYSKPCVPVASFSRDSKSLEQYGENMELEWKPDSTSVAVLTSKGFLSFYEVKFHPNQHVYEQVDSHIPGLKRESAELFSKDHVPLFSLKPTLTIPIDSGGTGMICIREELMVSTKYGHVLRLQWNGNLNRDYCLDLRRIPFCEDQLSSKAVPITEPNTYIVEIDYSPLLGGFAVVFNDGRAAFLTATTLKFDPNQVQGIWAPVDDVTCTAINHRYRLIAYGRQSSQGCVYTIDESTGGLQISHTLQLSDKDYPGTPGPVQLLRWSPDGCCLAMAWTRGGLSLWSTFGALLLCTLNWDYGSIQHCPLDIHAMDWGIEGYQLWMISSEDSALLQYELVKSPLTANPCMNAKERLYLHGQDRIYINISDANPRQSTPSEGAPSALLSNKQWHIVQVPSSYMGGNWPLRFAALDSKTEYVAVAGRTGVAIYSRFKRRWKLFGNESQERDFVVTGGLLWSGAACGTPHLIMGCYNITSDRDEIRLYPRDAPRLDNSFAIVHQVNGQILLLSIMDNSLLVYTSDCHITLFDLESSTSGVQINRTQEIDVSTLRLHPACIVAATLTSLSHATELDQMHSHQQNILLNVCGRVLLIQRNDGSNSGSGDEGDENAPYYAAPTVLASSVDILWVPSPGEVSSLKPHLTQALWLCCGAHGMRVWLPLFPREGDKGQHAFMSKRIMLPFQLNIYPLSVLFEEAILIGVETETVPYPIIATKRDLGPLCVLERNSQVYLHHIFRQLIRRNLGYHAWEIARSCTDLPYFSHSLELLLHEVLEEEATSKEPIPDALLPSVLQFIGEFPVYLATVVQCARKTEVALWPYLFGVGAIANPRQLFQRCLETKKLELAASYLIILQNMEPVTISRQSAIVLLDAALEARNWDLAKDLIRFLRAIDPSDVEPSTPTASWKPGSAPSPAGALLSAKIGLGSQTPPVSPNPEDFNFLLGSTVHRPGSRAAGNIKGSSVESNVVHHQATRSISDAGKVSQTSSTSKENITPVSGKSLGRKKSAPASTSPITVNVNQEIGEQGADEFFMDVILQRHVRRLLSTGQLKDLGFMSAALECNIVSWFGKERSRAARIDDFVSAIQRVHIDFEWPYPHLQQLNRKVSVVQEVSLEDKLRALEVDVSVATQTPIALVREPSLPFSAKEDGSCSFRAVSPTPSNGGLLLQTVEAQLQPHALDNWSIQSEADVISLAGEDRISELDSISINDPMLNSGPVASEGDSTNESALAETEAQLKYLLNQFTEAECLDWALVLAFVLRDAMTVLRLVSMARSAVTGSQCSHKAAAVENVTRLRDGLLAISYWVDTGCQGYKPFMNVIYSQVSTLTKLIIPSNGPSSSPSLTAEINSSDKSSSIPSAANRFRNISSSSLLDRVAEEGVIPVSHTNGTVELSEDSELVDNQVSSRTKDSVKDSRTIDSRCLQQSIESDQSKKLDDHQSIPHSSSCVIS